MASIKDFSEKIKDLARFRGSWNSALSDDLFLGLIIVLVAIGAFGLGRISKIEGSKVPIKIENAPVQEGAAQTAPGETVSNQSASVLGVAQTAESFVASKSGKKY